MTWSTKQSRGTQVAHGSARASHNTGPLGTGSQYRITNWGRMWGWVSQQPTLKDLDPEAAPQPRLACSSPHLYMNITKSHHIGVVGVLSGGPRVGSQGCKDDLYLP